MQLDSHSGITRRRTLKTAASSFLILPARSARASAANGKLDVGVIGVRGMGGVDARMLAGLGENVAAPCDVDAAALEKRGAEHPQARRYTDFRDMIDKEKLDGVVVATPDHNHAYISVYAMRRGLHVYCQKPLCQSIHEARVMARVAAETKAITQMGASSSAEPRNMRAIELIQSGALGEITEAHLATDRPIWPQGHSRPAGEEPLPEGLNWDLWSGTAPVRPFRAKWPEGHPIYGQEKKPAQGGALYHPFVWRGWIDYGTGALGDIAPHAMNVIFMALDLGAPAAAEVVETSGMTPHMFPAWSVIRFDFPPRSIHPPLRIYWYDGGKRPPASIIEPPRPPRPGEPFRAAAGSPGSGPRVVSRPGADHLQRRASNHTPRRRSAIGSERRSTRTGWWRSRQGSCRHAISATPGRSPRRTCWVTSRCAWDTGWSGIRWRSASPIAAKPIST